MTVEEIKNKFKPGMRIKLIHMIDPYSVPDGTLGTVHHVDDIGTVHMDWDNGSSLGLIADEDKYEIVGE